MGHKESYFCYWDGRNTEDTPMADQAIQCFDAYLSEVSQVGRAGNLEVAVRPPWTHQSRGSTGRCEALVASPHCPSRF